jgi:hypothetical protein
MIGIPFLSLSLVNVVPRSDTHSAPTTAVHHPISEPTATFHIMFRIPSTKAFTVLIVSTQVLERRLVTFCPLVIRFHLLLRFRGVSDDDQRPGQRHVSSTDAPASAATTVPSTSTATAPTWFSAEHSLGRPIPQSSLVAYTRHICDEDDPSP